MTRGFSLKRRVLGGMGQRANIPRPPLGEVRTSIRVPMVSGTRRGGSSEKAKVSVKGLEADVSTRLRLGVVKTVEVDVGVGTPILRVLGGNCAMILVGSEGKVISRYPKASHVQQCSRQYNF